MPPPFRPFGLVHLVAVALVVAVIAAFVAIARGGSRERAHSLGRGLGWFLLVYYVAEGVFRVGYQGVPLSHQMPFEICNALFFVAAYGLIGRNEAALDVTYLWAFAATLHSLLTPTPGEGFPSLELVRYFVTHGLLMLAGTYALLVLDAPVTWWSLVRASIALQVLELVVAGVDVALDKNFMYLRHPPPSPTLIDSLGPWPVYLVSLELVAIASFALWIAIARGVRRVLPVRAEPSAS